MAPKKKGGGKKGGGKGKKEEGGEGSADMGPAELLKRAAWRIESLERQLVWREEKVSQATAAQKELRDRVRDRSNAQREQAGSTSRAACLARSRCGSAWTASRHDC